MSMKLSIVLGRHGQVEDLRSGAVRIPGYELSFIDVKQMPHAYRDMARSQPYDICEMAPTTYLMAVASGAPITALAIPMTRRFRHQGLLKRRDSTLRTPKDLEGRSVGVRNYSVTAAVWTRGILADEYAVDLNRITWLTEEEENVESFKLPQNVRRVESQRTLAGLLQAGELDAAFAGLAGAGDASAANLVELIDDAEKREREWFKRSGIYPLHGVIVVRNEVLSRHPDLPLALFDAFRQAKQNYLARIQREASSAEDRRYLQLSEHVGDPLPYGLDENARSFEALIRYAHQQHLIPTEPPIESVFRDPRALTIMLGTYNKTAPLKSGAVTSPSIKLKFADVDVAQKAFKDTVRRLKFEVSELAIVTFLLAFDAGKPYVLLPFVMNGNFHHKSILCRAASDLQPGELRGKTVAMRSYSQTTPTWVRGILAHDYGVRLGEVRWLSQEGAHVEEFHDPEFVTPIHSSLSLEHLLRTHEVDAIIAGSGLSGNPGLRPLIPDPNEAALEWSRRTGAVPINHVVAIRKEIAESQPEVVREVFRMLCESRAIGEESSPSPSGPDLQPVGIEKLERSLNLIVQFAFEQGLIRQRYAVEQLYGPVIHILR